MLLQINPGYLAQLTVRVHHLLLVLDAGLLQLLAAALRILPDNGQFVADPTQLIREFLPVLADRFGDLEQVLPAVREGPSYRLSIIEAPATRMNMTYPCLPNFFSWSCCICCANLAMERAYSSSMAARRSMYVVTSRLD